MKFLKPLIYLFLGLILFLALPSCDKQATAKVETTIERKADFEYIQKEILTTTCAVVVVMVLLLVQPFAS
jgi:hypothetical protein